MDITQQFTDLVQGPEGNIRLDRGALLIAAHAQPDLDIEAQLTKLDRIADECPYHNPPALAQHLFVTLGFSGNTSSYNDPRNSYLDQVLDRRLGIPITLSLLMIEISRRLGMDLYGIGMPGHFLVSTADGRVFYDPFHEGKQLNAEQCQEMFYRMHGTQVPFLAAMLLPVSSRAILSRMLTNLLQSFRLSYQIEGAWAARLHLRIPNLPLMLRAQLANALGETGNFAEAISVLQALAQEAPPDLRDLLHSKAQHFASRLN